MRYFLIAIILLFLCNETANSQKTKSKEWIKITEKSIIQVPENKTPFVLLKDDVYKQDKDSVLVRRDGKTFKLAIKGLQYVPVEKPLVLAGDFFYDKNELIFEYDGQSLALNTENLFSHDTLIEDLKPIEIFAIKTDVKLYEKELIGSITKKVRIKIPFNHDKIKDSVRYFHFRTKYNEVVQFSVPPADTTIKNNVVLEFSGLESPLFMDEISGNLKIRNKTEKTIIIKSPSIRFGNNDSLISLSSLNKDTSIEEEIIRKQIPFDIYSGLTKLNKPVSLEEISKTILGVSWWIWLIVALSITVVFLVYKYIMKNRNRKGSGETKKVQSGGKDDYIENTTDNSMNISQQKVSQIIPASVSEAEELIRAAEQLKSSADALIQKAEGLKKEIRARDENQKAKEELDAARNQLKDKDKTIANQNNEISRLNQSIIQKNNEIKTIINEKQKIESQKAELEKEFTSIDGDPKYPRLKDFENLYGTIKNIAHKIDFYFKNMEPDTENPHYKWVQEIWINTKVLSRIEIIELLIKGLNEASEKARTVNPVIKEIIKEIIIPSKDFHEKITGYIRNEFINSPDFKAVFYNTERFMVADKVAASPFPDKYEASKKEIAGLRKQLENFIRVFDLASPEGLSIFYDWQNDPNRIKRYLHAYSSVYPDKKYPLAKLKDDTVLILDIHNWGYLEKGNTEKLFGGMKFIEVTITKL